MPRGMLPFLLLLGLLVVPGLLTRLPPGREQAMQELTDGALDRRARLSALAIVLRGGRDPQAAPGERLAGACAAIELEDRGGFLQIWPHVAIGRCDAGEIARATFGAAHLRELMLALHAEAAGEIDTARRQFARAELSARFAAAGLASQLAAEGMQRLTH